MGALNDFAGWVRRRPALRKTAKLLVRMIPDREVTLNKPEVGKIRIRMRSHRWLLWERFLQDDGLMLGVFDRLVHEGDVVYDIGANIGLYARVLPQWFGAKMVAAFEPMSQNFELLRQNVALGKLDAKVRMFQMALSDVNGEEDLQIDDMNSGEAVLNSVSHGEASGGRKEWGLPPKTERVKVRTLDDVV
ncbi:MAG TPA: FkbM family methyltransferase, partial [Phycisphaerales bacterium]|nr:FkbM family methyltransferase [Phycisphaerales bacterium]